MTLASRHALQNLRGQAEKQSRTQQMYDRRIGGWLTWEDVQKARGGIAHIGKLIAGDPEAVGGKVRLLVDVGHRRGWHGLGVAR